MLTKKSSVEYWFSCAKMLMHTLIDLFEYYQCTVHTFLKSNTNHLKNSPLKWHIFILMRMIYGNIPYWCKNCIILFSRHHEQKIKAGLGAVPQNGDLRRIFQPVTTHSKWLLQGILPKKFFFCLNRLYSTTDCHTFSLLIEALNSWWTLTDCITLNIRHSFYCFDS